jgi:hypothetical protein
MIGLPTGNCSMELISRKMGNIIARKLTLTSVCFVLAQTPVFTGFGAALVSMIAAIM